ncbi:hypothetical protein E2C01_049332 [Portunus trituberculatus]|uniref:Uncharacterized protein n=1 Tax=Portunus trituberculatus TaxID=210409 RepID=A0A5B7GDL0_PORTR|nr:hypothetical protein [Portunus trituberculatus]
MFLRLVITVRINCKSLNNFNLFSTGTHFYLEICVRLDNFIDIRSMGFRRLMATIFTILIPHMSF